MNKKWPDDITEPLTAGKLKEYLKALEEGWSEQDIEYLGEFDDLPITCAGVRQGYCPAGVSTAYADIMFFALERK